MKETSTKKHSSKAKKGSKRRQKRVTLKDSESFYYSLVENIPQYIFCKDTNGCFTFVNHLFCDLLEKSIDEIIGKTDLDFFPLALAQKYRNDDKQVMGENKTLEVIEENKISHHESKFVHVVKTPIHNANGVLIGTQGIFWDITSRIKAEQDLKSANERMKQDLIAASKVQRGFIPQESPQVPGYTFSWLFEPSEYVGGDLLNVIRLDETHWAFYILDVSGHGVPAALLSVSISRMLDQASFSVIDKKHQEGATDKLFDPSKVVEQLAKRFPGDSMKFCTLLYAVLDTETDSLRWVRAGHLSPLLLNLREQSSTFLDDPCSSCISKYMSSVDVEYSVGEIQIKPGDRFILYSDGLTEAMKRDQEFGLERFAETMQRSADKPLDESLSDVVRQVSDWTLEDHFADDVTILGLERKNGSS